MAAHDVFGRAAHTGALKVVLEARCLRPGPCLHSSVTHEIASRGGAKRTNNEQPRCVDGLVMGYLQRRGERRLPATPVRATTLAVAPATAA